MKIVTVNEETKEEGGSLCNVDMNTIHNVLTTPEYISAAYNTYKKTLHESLELTWRQNNLQISRQALSEEEIKVVATARTPQHQGKTLQSSQVPEQPPTHNNKNAEPDPEEPLSKNFDAALYAQSVASYEEFHKS